MCIRDRAMEKAKDELGLVNFKTPEEYLAFNDYTVWTKLKESEKSKEIIENLEKRKLLKCAFERTFYEKDRTVSRIFDFEEIRNQIRNEIAQKAGVEAEKVIIDVPTLPSVPYRHSVLMEPMEIPVFYKTKDGEKIPKRLSEVSGIFDVLKGFMNIIRVYTEAPYREKVGQAAVEVLGGTPYSAQISF